MSLHYIVGYLISEGTVSVGDMYYLLYSLIRP
jgi:hypothetical protein